MRRYSLTRESAKPTGPAGPTGSTGSVASTGSVESAKPVGHARPVASVVHFGLCPRRPLTLAFCLTLISCLTLVSCGSPEASKLGEGSYHVGRGSGRSFVLPDGSRVTVSPGTTITLAKGFGRDNRDIDLDGEARFDVAATPGYPLVIHTRDLVIEVLGTRFHVDAFRAGPGEEVDLLTGRLRVKKSYHSDSDNEPEVLEAGDMVMINHDIDLMEKEKLSPDELNKLKAMW